MTKSLITRCLLAPLPLFLIVLPLLGCVGMGGGGEPEQITPVQQVSIAAHNLFGTGQHDAIAQSDARKAADALERAEEQTCAEAEPYRNAARATAEDTATLAGESAGILTSVQTAMEQAGDASRIAGDADDRAGRSREAFDAADEALEDVMHFNSRANLGKQVGQVWEIAETQFNALRNLSRDVQRAAGELQAALETEEGQALRAWIEPGEDIDAMLEDVIAHADAANDEWIRLESVEIDLPEDRSTRIEQMDRSERADLEAHLGALDAAGGVAEAAHAGLQQATDILARAQERINHFMSEQTERTRAIIEETGPLAAEATRNAWLAVEACGGEIPEEFQDWVENPFYDYTTLPRWNSTFWDISSP